jgi:hypothetical protein
VRTIAARLHVLLARDAPIGVVIRRGPSRHVAVIGWNRKSDRFEIGQWLYGRIYEQRCDLSPDGRHFIYFAMNGRWDSAVKGSWTAVSKAPYLKAVTLLAKGDCWHGGGLFLSTTKYWLNDGYGHNVLHDHSRLERSLPYPWHEVYGGECPGVYYIRLQRDGWAMKHTSQSSTGGKITLFEKRLSGHWKLHKLAHATTAPPAGRGCYFDRHRLWNARRETGIDFPKWEWADVDRERLVFAEEGKLFSARVGSNGPTRVEQLYDFNPLHFEKLVAPY